MPFPTAPRAPLRWNLLSREDGTTWSGIQELLAEEGFLLVEDEHGVDASCPGDSSPLTPVLVTPGAPLSRQASTVLARSVERFWGAERITFGVLGYHPLPHSAAGWLPRDGVDGVGHPVFWLPRSARLFGNKLWAGESFAHYRETLEQIRLWHEIEMRRYGNRYSGTVTDVLVAADVPSVTHTPCVSDDFDRPLVLDVPNHLVSPAAVSWWAAALAVALVRQCHEQIVATELGDVNNMVFQAMMAAESASVPETMCHFEQSQKRYEERGDQESVYGLFDAVRSTVDTLYQTMAGPCLVLEEVAIQRRCGFKEGPSMAGLLYARSELGALHDSVCARLAGARTTVERRAAATDAWNALASCAYRWLIRLKAAATKASPVDRSEYLVPAPRALEVPYEVLPSVIRLDEAVGGAWRASAS